MEPSPLPPTPSQTDNDSELRELAALAGLLNPESIWALETKLDSLNAAPATPPAPLPTGHLGDSAADTLPEQDHPPRQ